MLRTGEENARADPEGHARPSRADARGRRSRWARALGAPLAIATLGAWLLFAPFRWPCPLRWVLGLPCPSCGMTRAMRLALRGDVAGATAMHPLWLPVAAAGAFALAIEVRGFARSGAWGAAATHPIVRRGAPFVVGALVVVWLARFAGALGGPVAP